MSGLGTAFAGFRLGERLLGIHPVVGRAWHWVTDNRTHLIATGVAAVIVPLALWGALEHHAATKWHRVADHCAAARKADQVAAAARFAANQNRIDTRGALYEQDQAAGTAEQHDREDRIRTIYRDRPVPGTCAAPDAARRVLDDAVAAANARARGEPGRVVPGPAEPAAPAARP